MTAPNEPASIPSARTLAKTTVVAALLAALILVTIVMPAEYNRDPLGTGRLLGLTRLAAPAIVEPPAPPPGGQAFAPTVRGPAAVYPGSFKTDSTEFVLGPYEFVEYKYHLEQGASMLYSWKATVPVIHEFHGDRDGTIDEPVSYDKRDTRGESGSFAAPFSGIHGWYWENPGAESVTISVASAGFYTSAIEFRSDNTRRPHSLDEPRGTTPPLTR